MVLERSFVRAWNWTCRVSGCGRPIYNYPIEVNFMGLSESTANVINSFWQTRLPLKGTNVKIDVLNNRRHQINGVFLPAVFLTVCTIQFATYHLTRAPRVKSQKPAPGWEAPKDYDFEHLPKTAGNIALWKKMHEMKGQDWDVRGGSELDISKGTHGWYHGQDAHMEHELHFEDPAAPLNDGHGHGHGGGHH